MSGASAFDRFDRRTARDLYRSWLWANGWAELAGLGGTFLLGLAGARWVEGRAPTALTLIAGVLAAILLGSFLEGVVVGWAQARVLAPRIAGFSPRSWIAATALGAGVAWALGLVPSTIAHRLSEPAAASAAPPIEPSGGLVALLAAGMGVVLGVVLGLPQSRVLRRHVPHAGRWIAANAAAWAVGMPVIYTGLDLAFDRAATPLRLALVLTTCLAAGLIVGAIHGAVLVGLLRGAPAGAAASLRS